MAGRFFPGDHIGSCEFDLVCEPQCGALFACAIQNYIGSHGSAFLIRLLGVLLSGALQTPRCPEISRLTVELSRAGDSIILQPP